MLELQAPWLSRCSWRTPLCPRHSIALSPSHTMQATTNTGRAGAEAVAAGHRPLRQLSFKRTSDLSRDNVMKQAANLKDLALGMALPGVLINTSPTDFAPIEQEQMARCNGGRWERFDPIINGALTGG
jgi:hypothetical protein